MTAPLGLRLMMPLVVPVFVFSVWCILFWRPRRAPDEPGGWNSKCIVVDGCEWRQIAVMADCCGGRVLWGMAGGEVVAPRW